MMGECLDYVGEFNSDFGRLSSMHLAMDYFKNPDYHRQSSKDVMLAAQIYDDLTEQLGYLSQVQTVRVQYVDSIR